MKQLRRCPQGYQNELKSRRNSSQIRRARAEALLLELEKGQVESPNFFESLKSTLKESASVADFKPKTTVEIGDLDSLTTKEEVIKAIESALGEPLTQK